MKILKTLFLLTIILATLYSCNDDNSHSYKKNRKLRYLFYANGGLIGYYDDGTVTGCQKCILTKVNIDAMNLVKPFKTYVVKLDGSLLTDDKDVQHPNINDTSEWAMVDYKWLIQIQPL